MVAKGFAEATVGTHYDGRPADVRALDAYIKLTRALSSVEARLAPGLADAGLTPTQLGILEALLHLGPLGQRTLGAKLLSSGGNITTVVDNLERRGLVRRERRDDDRRHGVIPPARSRSIITMSIERASSMWRNGTMP